jgi:hypothetical protein
MPPSLTTAIASLISSWRERNHRLDELEKEVASIKLIPGPAPRGMRIKRLGRIEEPDPWPPDSARRLIRHQALKRGANLIIHYQEESAEEKGCIRCRGEAVLGSEEDSE